MSEKEILIKFLDKYGDWIDSGKLREYRLEHEGNSYVLGYRADRNARDFVNKENATKDQFEQEGEYHDIKFVISGRMRTGEKGQRIRQYKLRIVNGVRIEKPKTSEQIKTEGLNDQLRALIKGRNWDEAQEIQRAVASKEEWLKEATIKKYRK